MERQVSFVLTQDDVAATLGIENDPKPAVLKSISRFIGAWVFILLVFLGFGFFLGGKEKLLEPDTLKLLLGGWLVLTVFILLCNLIGYLLAILKQRKKTKLNDDRIDTSFIFGWDENALSIRSGNMKGSYPWQLFYGFVEYPAFVAFYTAPEKFHILPKRVLSKQQLLDLRAILLAEIQKIQEAEKQKA